MCSRQGHRFELHRHWFGCRNDLLLVRLPICINSRILNMHLWHSFENEYVKCLALVSLHYESIVKIVNELIPK